VTRRLVVCTCSREQAGLTEHELRRAGWRLVEACTTNEQPVASRTPLVVAFVWVCPFCAEQRNALLRARSAS